MYGATIGKTSYLEFETTTNQACCVFCEGDIIDNKFLQFWFKANQEQIITLAIGGGQPNISQSIIKHIRLFCPSLDEQKLIVKNLDKKTSELDTLITKKEKLIELLKEERTAIINQAVTKGLDPDVEMKDSGVDGGDHRWLGEIPAHWKRMKLRYVADKITDGEHISPTFLDEGVPFLSAKDVRDRSINYDVDKFVSFEDAEKFRRRCDPERNDVLIVSRGATIGRVGLVEDDKVFCLLGSVILIKVKSNIHSLYLYYLLSSTKIQEQLNLASQSSAQQAIYLVSVSELNIPVPTIREQILIEKYLKQFDEKYFLALEAINQEITLLKEYKTALISEVVTGKVKVI